MKTSALLALALLALPLAAQTGLKPLVKDAPPPEPKAPANPPEPPKETIFALKLKAVGAPLPILRHELLPSQRELSKTNAAVYYHRAMLMMGDSGLKGKEAGEARMKMDELLGKPLAETPAESLRDYVKYYSPAMFRELEAAAKCRDADWGIGERISIEAYNLLLPEVQKTRELAFLLKVRCRLHQKEGNLEAALHDIQTGLMLGRHVGRSETMISFLVGTAISAIMIHELDRVLEMPKCPNLYWSLTALPRPFIPLDLAVEGELRSLDAMLPIPKDLEEPMSAEQARLTLDSVIARIQKFNTDLGGPGIPKMGLQETRLGLAAYVTLMHPNARKSLLAAGKTEVELNAMPAAQVVLLDSVLRYRDVRDECLGIWMTLPPEEASAGLRKAEERIRELRNSPTDYFATMLTQLLPATQKVYEAQLRTQRRLASQRVVEAVRLHSAKNGKAPAKLSDITIVPVPNDPADGKPFGYASDDKGFTVTVPAPPGQIANLGNAWKYQITWVK